MNGLQPWMQSELWWQNVKTLATSIIVADKMLDFWGELKTGPKNTKDSQGEKRKQDKGNKKYKGK